MSDQIGQPLEELRAERDRIQGAIDQLQGILGNRAGPVRTRRPRLSGLGTRPRADVERSPSRAPRNAPRGMLRQKVHQVLSKARLLSPAKLRDALIKAGYPSHNPRTLYTQLFALVKADPQLRKTTEGFSLKGGKQSRAKRESKPRKPPPRKESVRKKPIASTKKPQKRKAKISSIDRSDTASKGPAVKPTPMPTSSKKVVAAPSKAPGSVSNAKPGE